MRHCDICAGNVIRMRRKRHATQASLAILCDNMSSDKMSRVTVVVDITPPHRKNSLSLKQHNKNEMKHRRSKQTMKYWKLNMIYLRKNYKETAKKDRQYETSRMANKRNNIFEWKYSCKKSHFLQQLNTFLSLPNLRSEPSGLCYKVLWS
jgi:hypothetical protein